jgi:hypothetical protein
MERRYSALRTIGTIYKILGVIAGILTLLIALSICGASIFGMPVFNNMMHQYGGGSVGSSFGSVFVGIVTSLFALIYGGGLTVTLYGFGEGVYLLISMEENTRATREALEKKPEAS